MENKEILKALYGIIATLVATMIIGGVVMYGSVSAIGNNDKNQDRDMIRVEAQHKADMSDIKEDIKEIKSDIKTLLEKK